MFSVPEKYRVRTGPMGSGPEYGCNGQFVIHSIKLRRPLFVQASDGIGWEHVSVSLKDRTPSWDEMAFIKDMFWGEDDLVVQYHPRKAGYINNHKYCLHLWRKAGTNDFCAEPPTALV